MSFWPAAAVHNGMRVGVHQGFRVIWGLSRLETVVQLRPERTPRRYICCRAVSFCIDPPHDLRPIAMYSTAGASPPRPNTKYAQTMRKQSVCVVCIYLKNVRHARHVNKCILRAGNLGRERGNAAGGLPESRRAYGSSREVERATRRILSMWLGHGVVDVGENKSMSGWVSALS